VSKISTIHEINAKHVHSVTHKTAKTTCRVRYN